MISIEQVTINFGGFSLFSNISLYINSNDKIGLVGKNGAGKSTLLKVIAKLQPYDEGNINVPNSLKIGYLPQQLEIIDGKTVYEETLTAFSEVLELEHEIEMANVQLSKRTDYESEEYSKLINWVSDANERYHLISGGSIEADIEKTLLGLGFLATDFTRLTSEFSGGWRMRVEIAKILLQKPDVLLLDEPTNHLDIESIQWLEDFLVNFQGAVVLVSHDRKFLDDVTKRTVEISLGKINDYKVPYTRYVELRKERMEQQVSAYNNQQKKIEDTEKFIERFRYKATKSVQVQSRIKQLNKLDRLEVDQEDNSAMHFRFPPAPRSGNIVFESIGLTKNYDEHIVLNNIDFKIERGEKVAFVGRNGEGKTTFAKIIVGILDYLGEANFANNVKIGYYAQNQSDIFDENLTVFQTIDNVAVGEIRTKIRNILGSFLFGGEDIDKKVRVLSGGERSRLALAKLLLEPINLLVLDEPTNHLDIRSKDILKRALLKYDGTLILVSHDRDFLDGLTDKIFEFKNNKIKEHIGGIYEFLEKKKLSSLRELEIKDNKNKDSNKAQASQNKIMFEEKKELEKNIKKISNQVSISERKIEDIELKIAEMSKKLDEHENKDQYIEYNTLFTEYETLKSDLDKEMENWTNFNEKLTELKNLRESYQNK